MVDTPVKQEQPQTQQSATNNVTSSTATTADSNNPRKDHYSYSYTYKTADPESGVPGVSTVEVNESVTEEIGPDGSKIIRRHQQEKQINKITQVVTQRVIKRQYIDPTTGQIIEYDPNNELFANLPPETVFEEHTVISDDNGNPPIVTTTTTSKTGQKIVKQHQITDQVKSLNLNEQDKIVSKDYIDNGYSTLTSINKATQQQHQSASFRVKSRPEDNQGYPEERNMDYDPDDCYPDDDTPYEGLIQPTNQTHESTTRQNKQHRHQKQQHLTTSGGESSGSSSSPILFDQSNGIDMPIISNNYQKSSHYSQASSSGRFQQHPQQQLHDQQGGYTAVLPSANMTPRSHHQNQPPQHYYSHYQTISHKNNNYEMPSEHYGTVPNQQTSSNYVKDAQSFRNSNEYG